LCIRPLELSLCERRAAFSVPEHTDRASINERVHHCKAPALREKHTGYACLPEEPFFKRVTKPKLGLFLASAGLD
jgi:hypothetical protein